MSIEGRTVAMAVVVWRWDDFHILVALLQVGSDIGAEGVSKAEVVAALVRKLLQGRDKGCVLGREDTYGVSKRLQHRRKLKTDKERRLTNDSMVSGLEELVGLGDGRELLGAGSGLLLHVLDNTRCRAGSLIRATLNALAEDLEGGVARDAEAGAQA